MLRALLALSLLPLLALTGCERDDLVIAGRCDESGCRACADGSPPTCWRLPYTPCSATIACGSGMVCTSIGCATACQVDSQCRLGEVCTTDRHCAPQGVSTTLIGGEALLGDPSSLACGARIPLCRISEECGTGRSCVDGACRLGCAGETCPVGQRCSGGLCVEASPAMAECLWDRDCVGGRCINAACHPACSTSGDCGPGEYCNGAVCRADPRPR